LVERAIGFSEPYEDLELTDRESAPAGELGGDLSANRFAPAKEATPQVLFPVVEVRHVVILGGVS